MPSEQSLFLYLMLKEMMEVSHLESVKFDSQYTLFPDQLKKAISGGNLGYGERLWGIDLEYRGCIYDIGD